MKTGKSTVEGVKTRLMIAGAAIEISSRFPVCSSRQDDIRGITPFVARSGRPADISVEVTLDTALETPKGAPLFSCVNPLSKTLVWRIRRKNTGFVVENFNSPPGQMRCDRDFRRAAITFTAAGDRVWKLSDVVYNYLQLALIPFLAPRGGMCVHSAAMRMGAKGIVFPGISGAGKSTLARLCHGRAGLRALNDDRNYVRPAPGAGFTLYGNPWHGDFREYLREPGYRDSARLAAIVFVRHGRRNSLRKLAPSAALELLLPKVFMPFWSPERMRGLVDSCASLTRRAQCLELGFVNDSDIVPFVAKELFA